MLSDILKLLMLLKIYLCHSYALNIRNWSQCREMENLRLTTNIGVLTTPSVIACAVECANNPPCMSYSYHAGNNTCLLYDIPFTDGTLGTVSENGWNSYSLMYDGAIDCLDIRDKGVTVSGVYTITLGGSKLTRVYCDMDTDGGGWTVFQRRVDGDVDFYLGWNDYKVGFGDVADEFWLGNENLYLLTSLGETEMRVDLEDFENNTVYADYASFWIGDETTSFKLHVSGFSGSAKDALAYHDGEAFTTKDEDNDYAYYNCATEYTGAWWYKACHRCNLNGQYLSGNNIVDLKGVTWAPWKNQHYSLKQTKMMARRTANDQDER